MSDSPEVATSGHARGRVIAVVWACITVLLLMLAVGDARLDWHDRTLVFAPVVLAGVVAASGTRIIGELMAFGFACGLTVVAIPLVPAAVLTILLGAPQIGGAGLLLMAFQVGCVVAFIRVGTLTKMSETVLNAALVLACAIFVAVASRRVMGQDDARRTQADLRSMIVAVRPRTRAIRRLS